MGTDVAERVPMVRVARAGDLGEQKKPYRLKISANGQVTIPKELREELEWKPGDVLMFMPRKGYFEIAKQRSLREEMTEWRKTLSPKTKEMVGKTAGWTLKQYHDYFDNLPENVAGMKEKYGVR